MSYFNSEQEDYMRSLAAIPETERCFCGWDRFGECYNCKRDSFATGKTLADRRSLECPHCGNYQHREGGTITHRIGCPARDQLEQPTKQ